MSDPTHDLARLIRQAPPSVGSKDQHLSLSRGVITNVGSNGICSLTLDGDSTVLSAEMLSSYSVLVDDVVEVLHVDTRLIVLGAVNDYDGGSGLLFGSGPGWQFLSGLWYPVTYFYPIATAVPNGTFDAYPFFVGETTSFDHIGINVGGAGGGGSKVDLGVYDDDGSLIPNARLAQVTNTTLVSGPLSVALSVTLTPGLYWLSAMFHSSGGTPAVNCDDGPGSSILGGNIPASSGSPTQTATGIHLTGQPTGLPSTFPFPGSPAYTSPTTIVNLQAV